MGQLIIFYISEVLKVAAYDKNDLQCQNLKSLLQSYRLAKASILLDSKPSKINHQDTQMFS